MKRLITVLLFAVVSVAICVAQSTIRNFHQEGIATQDISSNELTATHPSLPIGTQVKVTNTQNGKEVIAKIIGRIPASVDRIVDLSTAAARDLALPAQGVAPVILEVVDNRTPPVVAVASPPPEPEPPAPTPEPEPTPEPVPPAPTPEPVSVSQTDTNTDASTINDTRTQTTAPAQSPNINIYNINMSPNAMATDSAPVNATGGSQLPADFNGSGIPAGIIAVAPTGNVTNTKQTVTPPPPTPVPAPAPVPAPVPAPAPAPREPAVATASTIITVQPPSPEVRTTIQTVPVMPPLEPAAPQPATVTAPVVVPPPQRLEPAPQPTVQDVGTALITPYMPNPNSGKIYRVQVGSFTDTWHAKEAFDRLTMVGFKPAFERYGDYIRVVIPGIKTVDMPAVARLIGQVGFREALIREEN